MCDPVSMVGAALTAGSMFANNAAQNRVAKARDSAMLAERERQRALDSEATALNDTSRGRYTGFDGQREAKTSELTAFFNAQNQPIEAPPAGEAASGDNIVVREARKQQNKAKAYGDQQGAALAQLRSFGDLLGGISRGQARDAAQVGTIGGFQRGSANVLPFELDAANRKGDSLGTLGGVLGGLGQVGMMAGLSGAGPATFFDVSKPMQGPLRPGQARPNVTQKGLFGANPFSFTG